MWIEELRWDCARGWGGQSGKAGAAAGLVLYFGDRNALREEARFAELRAAYRAAHIVGCSATCTIVGDALEKDGIVALRWASRARPFVSRSITFEICPARKRRGRPWGMLLLPRISPLCSCLPTGFASMAAASSPA